MLHHMHLASCNGADLLELRLDRISNFQPQSDLPALLAARTLPVIVTCRPKWEGGGYDGDESQRLDALLLAVDLGAEYIDVELKVATDFLASLKKKDAENCQIIVSYHSHLKSLSADELETVVAGIQSAGADIVKIATTADNITDVAPMFRLLAHSQVPTIVLAMGPKGQISRFLCPKFGSYLTFGSLGSGLESAPGQPTLLELRNVYRSGQVNGATEVFGVVSSPVGHSKGPILHNAAFAEIGFNGIYLPFLVDDLAEFFKVYADEFKFSGFSIGLPHKANALRYCDEIDSTAAAVGAVNTIIRRKTDGKLIGYNTDSEAAISAIEDGLAELQGTKGNLLQGRLVVVIGSGGAGKAIAFGAKQRGANVLVTDYIYERAKVLADAVEGKALLLEMLDDFCPESGTILANASPVGMHPNVDKSPISKKALTNYCLVFDAIYTPGVTKLLKEAAECGAAVVSGLEMFIRQATAQFELFTGHHAPEKRMREIVSSFTSAERL